jgi:hypothetical protein
VSYRDDLEAAVARADGLERELAAARAKLDRARAQAPQVPPVDGPPIATSPRPRFDVWSLLAIVIVVVALLIVIIALGKRSSSTSQAAPAPAAPAPLPPVTPTNGFDVSNGFTEAERRANELVAGAWLATMSAWPVSADGRSDRVAGEVSYTYCAPSDSSQPCLINIVVTGTDFHSPPLGCSTAAIDDCPRSSPPRCDVRHVWDEARRKGVPSTVAATITYRQSWWHFTLDGGKSSSFDLWVPDDCR